MSEQSEERDPAAEGEQDEEKRLLEDIDPSDEESSDVTGGVRQQKQIKRGGPLQ